MTTPNISIRLTLHKECIDHMRKEYAEKDTPHKVEIHRLLKDTEKALNKAIDVLEREEKSHAPQSQQTQPN